MSKGKTVAIVAVIGVVVLLGGAVVFALFGVGAYLLARDGAPGPSDEDEQTAGMIALGGGRAVFVQGYGISEPMIVRGVHVSGSALREDWRWSGPAGHGSYGWMWRHRGDIVVGELHRSQGMGPRRLACFHAERGLIGELPSVSDGAWILSDDGTELLAHSGDALVSYGTEPFAERWRAPTSDCRVVPRLALTPTLAIYYDGSIRIVRRGDGSLVRDVEGREVAGIDRSRGELLYRREGRIVVESLESGAERLVLDLAGGAEIVDGMEEPTLLGSHAGRWLFIYATELDHIFSSNSAPSWTRNAPRWLAAVDPETGAVAWRATLGPWPRWHAMWNQELYDERELPAELLMYSDNDAEGGVTMGHLAYVSLTDGAIRWQLDYPSATRGNALFASVGDVAYLRIREENEGSRSALARFERGRLTSAIWLPEVGGDVREPMVLADEAWIPTGIQSWALVGRDLRARAHGGPAEPPSDARAFATQRLGL